MQTFIEFGDAVTVRLSDSPMDELLRNVSKNSEKENKKFEYQCKSAQNIQSKFMQNRKNIINA